MFVAAKPFEEPLILSVEDRVGPNKDDVLGRCMLPLQCADRRLDHKAINIRWFNLEKMFMVGGRCNIPSKTTTIKLTTKCNLGFSSVTDFSSECNIASNLRNDFIEPTVSLFRVFQTLCKQGDWFSFAKRRAPFLVCIDDNRSCMKHWKSGFFLIDQRAILGAMLELGRSRFGDVWKSHVYDPVLRGADRNVVGIHDFICLPEWTGAEPVIPDPTPKDLAIGTPSFKIVDKAEASQKRKASTSGAALSHVAKRTRSALAQSSGSTTRPSLLVGDDDESGDDDDACVEIPLVTPLRYAVGKGVMVDDDVTPSFGVSRPRPSSRPAPSFKDVSDDAIHTDFFPFSVGPYYATYPKGGVAGNCEFIREEWDAPYRPTFRVLTKEVFKDLAVCKTMVDQFPTPSEMVGVKSLSDDQLTVLMKEVCKDPSICKTIVDRFPTLGEMVRVNTYEEKVANMTGLKLQVSALKKQVSGLNDKLTSSDASFAKSKAKGKERKKKIKDEEILRLKTTPPEFSSFFRGQFQCLVGKFLSSDEFSRVLGELISLAASTGFEHGLSMHRTKDELKKMISEYAAEPLSVILQLKPEKLVRPANVPIPRDTRVSSPIAKESTVTPVSKSLELSANVAPDSSTVVLEQNEESVFVQGVSHILDDVVKVTTVESKHVSSGPIDVVVALSVGGKGYVLIPSSVAGEEAAANSSRV
ncbi:hypothetical protein Tco_1338882 [Tanacetum coccineum]